MTSWEKRPDLLLHRRDNTAVSRTGDLICIEQEGDVNSQEVFCIHIDVSDVPLLIQRLEELSRGRE